MVNTDNRYLDNVVYDTMLGITDVAPKFVELEMSD